MASKDTVVEEDFLSVDPEIRGQGYVCLSFLSPEKILDKKELFFFQKFMKFYEAKVRFDGFEKFLSNFVRNQNDTNAQVVESVIKMVEDKVDEDVLEDIRNEVLRNKINVVDVFDSFKEFVESNRDLIASKENIVSSFDDFMFTRENELNKEFHELNEFQTSVRGVKIRGTYNSHKEACMRAKKLQKDDPLHNVYVGQVGYWLPWDPNPNDVEDQEYAEKELNELMKKYKENQEFKREMFETDKNKRVAAAKEDAARNSTTNTREAIEEPSGDDTSTTEVQSSKDQVTSISEARELMKEMDDSRLAINPSQSYVPPTSGADDDAQ